MIHARPPRRGWSRLSFSLMPLIDVVFLLVLFFALAQGASRARLEPIELPASTTGASAPEDPAPLVSLSADGSLRLDGRPVTLDALREALRDRRGAPPRIRADRALGYGRVREVLEALGHEGGRVALGVAPASDTDAGAEAPR